MKYLLDTQILLWGAGEPERLSPAARRQLSDPKKSFYSAPRAFGRSRSRNLSDAKTFASEPRLLGRGLLYNGFTEPVTSEHAVGVDALPDLHKDPFDRILLAQVLSEGITLLTADAQLARYPGPVRKI